MDNRDAAIKLVEGYEKGDCFSNVLKWLLEFNPSDDVHVVHGTVIGVDKNRIDHAWLEFGERVIDPTVGSNYNKTVYYRETGAVLNNWYFASQALQKAAKTGNAGPWN